LPAYTRGNLGVEAYLVRLLAAIVRQAGGELRVRGDLVDAVGEPTALIKEWDSRTQEIVLKAGMHSFTEVYRVIPEKQAQPTVVERPTDPLDNLFQPQRPNGETSAPARRGTTLDDEKNVRLERERTTRLARQVLSDELMRREEERRRQEVPHA
jgi:hypothetical protein